MVQETHLNRLKRKHQELDAKIIAEQKRPGSNDLEIGAMKREKLLLKERIERMRTNAA
jgi:hypothetical protein